MEVKAVMLGTLIFGSLIWVLYLWAWSAVDRLRISRGGPISLTIDRQSQPVSLFKSRLDRGGEEMDMTKSNSRGNRLVLSVLAAAALAAFNAGAATAQVNDMRCYNGMVNHCNRWYASEGYANVAECVYSSIDFCAEIENPPQLLCTDFGVECRWVWGGRT
jgi:hypothetical protein